MSDKLRDNIINLTLMLLSDTENVSTEDIRKKAALAKETFGMAAANVDAEAVSREVETMLSVNIGTVSALYDPRDHNPWLQDKKAQTEWDYWKRYEKYLRQYKKWPPAVVDSLDDVTDDILGATEDPTRDGQWDNRGMVVGQVQSGKTANYTAVICKAIDAGYRLIIVMSGVHNSLRSQTQLRIDEGVLGFDTKKSRSFQNDAKPIGVGLVPTKKLLVTHPLTTSEENGDFSTAVANSAPPKIGEEPFILVVKKNKSVLENIERWARSSMSVKNESGKAKIKEIPMLLIDDEADNASINTRTVHLNEQGVQDADDDVAAINGKIRDILSLFDKSSYIAYTATPFANIFVDHEVSNERYEDDVFPRNFIISLPAPTNYIGPAEFFGLNGKADISDSVVRTVNDASDYFPAGHKKDLVPGGIPETLENALLSFVLVCRLRTMQGQGDQHNSMLIHVTRFVDVQEHVRNDVRKFVTAVRRELEYTTDGPMTHRLRALYESDFAVTTEDVGRILYGTDIPPIPSWDEVREQLYDAAVKIEIKTLNGSAKDALDYIDHQEKGMHVIAIGGDKLSRGLTLEGLSVSYFLRSSKMYDTLMQMGRWFGYRPGYVHLCRLYTTTELVSHYRHIAVAAQELTEQFMEMAATGATPKEFGLRVLSHPAGQLMITAANKLKNGQKVQVSFAGSLVETRHFDKDAETLEANIGNAERLIADLSDTYEKKGVNYLWRNVAPEVVTAFLNSYQAHNAFVTSASGVTLSDYIRKQNEKGELVNWSIGLISKREAVKQDKIIDLGGIPVGLLTRKENRKSDSVYSLNKSRLGSSRDEALDLSPEAARSVRNGGKPAPGGLYRQLRNAQDGLLLLYALEPAESDGDAFIGYGVSFPDSSTAQSVTYTVNTVFRERNDV